MPSQALPLSFGRCQPIMSTAVFVAVLAVPIGACSCAWAHLHRRPHHHVHGAGQHDHGHCHDRQEVGQVGDRQGQRACTRGQGYVGRMCVVSRLKGGFEFRGVQG